MSRDALVVGINTYQSQGLSNLQAPAEDAEAIASLLEQHGEFRVWRFPEVFKQGENLPHVGKTKAVTLTQLEDALVNLFKPEGRNVPDTALFYFSGHGIRKNQGIQEGFLATSDVAPDKRFNGLSLQWLRRLLQESPVKQQIIWLDCCHSGELLNFAEANPGEQGQSRDRCFIAASREFEVAYQEIGSPYSILTKILLAGLDPKRCPERWVTNYSLVDYINQHLQGTIQRPIFTNFGEPINLTRIGEISHQVSTPETVATVCPYKGLAYFDCNDEDPKYFYGRGELTDQLIDKVRQSNFLAILGASGSGKSSVLRAGLLHQLKLGRKLAGSERSQAYIMVPGEHPLQSLALAFIDSNLPNLDRAAQLGKAERLIKEGADGVRRLVQSSNASRVVLVIDQFEEAFTLCQDVSEREQFFQCILGALEQTNHQLCLILAMRADFFGKCVEQEYSGLAKRIQNQLVTVQPMNREQLRQAITLPAQRVNLEIELELVAQMLQDVEGSPGSLPLLQYTLTELWKQRTDNCLKLATYSQLGGIGGTLNQRATEVYQQFSAKEQEAAKHIFLSLTQLGEGTEDTRRRVLKRDLVTAKHPEALIDAVVQKLADEKLVVTNFDPLLPPLRVKMEEDRSVIDVAHEALIRHWKQLQQWLNESRDNLRKQRKIEVDAAEWRNQGKKHDYLLQGRRLKEAKEFQKEQGELFPLSREAETFIKASIKHQRNNRVKLLGGLLVIPLIGTVLIGFFVYREIRIKQYWQTVNETKGEKYDVRRHEALENLNDLGQEFRNAPLEKANLEKIQLPEANLTGAYLPGAYLSGANLDGANLTGAYLSRANLDGANLTGAYLSRANLAEAKLYEAYLDGANLYGAYLREANLSRAGLTEAKLYEAYLDGANLTGAYLTGAYLTGAYLYEANLTRAYLYEANLTRANLTGANLTRANLTGANLKQADFTEDAIFGVKVKNLNPKQVKSACYWKEAKFDPDFLEKLKQEPDQKLDCSKWERFP